MQPRVDGQGAQSRNEPEVKVVAYIVRGDALVAFVHEDDDDPLLESGLQVPAGTVEPGEDLASAALREAFEETGLQGLRIVENLGFDEVTWPGGPVQQRHFFHVAADGGPDRWSHVERDGGGGDPRPFRLFWLPLPQARLLAAAQGVFASRITLRAP
jgi:8-oxo-dGTP pyrophosphatase MutT (NUDIX family)